MAKNYPQEASKTHGGFSTYAEKIDGKKIRIRSTSFADHFSQATLFWNSQSIHEKEHLIDALQFELSKVETAAIRERMVELLVNVNHDLAYQVAHGLGIHLRKNKKTQTKNTTQIQPTSQALSMAHSIKNTIHTRTVGILISDGADEIAISTIKRMLQKKKARVKILGPRLGVLVGKNNGKIIVNNTIVTTPSIVFDSIFIPGGKASIQALKKSPVALEFIQDAYKHFKTIAVMSDAEEFLKSAGIRVHEQNGILIGQAKQNMIEFGTKFINEMKQHRHWSRKI